MPVIIGTAPGSVAVINGPQTPLTVTIDGFTPTSTRAIITNFSITQRGGAQFLQTLEDFIYVYVFGDMMGNAQISGMFFAGACGQTVTLLEDKCDTSAPAGGGAARLAGWTCSRHHFESYGSSWAQPNRRLTFGLIQWNRRAPLTTRATYTTAGLSAIRRKRLLAPI